MGNRIVREGERAPRAIGPGGVLHGTFWMAALIGALALPSCESAGDGCVQGGPAAIEDATFAGSLGIDIGQMTRLQNGRLYIRDDVVGTGQATFEGAQLIVNYAGWYVDGTQFDSGQDFDFALGASNIIAGWNLGLEGMRQGGKRTLVVSPALGYGPCPFRQIPGNTILVFEVEMIQVGG